MAEGRLNKHFWIACLTRDVTYLRIWLPCRHQVRPAFWVVLASPLGALWTAPSYRGFFAFATVAQASVGDFFLLTEFPCEYRWSFNTRESCNQKEYSQLRLFSTMAVLTNAGSSLKFSPSSFFWCGGGGGRRRMDTVTDVFLDILNVNVKGTSYVLLLILSSFSWLDAADLLGLSHMRKVDELVSWSYCPSLEFGDIPGTETVHLLWFSYSLVKYWYSLSDISWWKCTIVVRLSSILAAPLSHKYPIKYNCCFTGSPEDCSMNCHCCTLLMLYTQACVCCLPTPQIMTDDSFVSFIQKVVTTNDIL